jgi:hypothetical protein
MANSEFQLRRDAFGKLILLGADGEDHVVVPVRAFPIQSPDQGISLVRDGGKEVAWIDDMATLPAHLRTLVQDELDGREFMPVISQIVDVSSFATPCTWTVKTDRGDASFTLKGEEDMRRVGDTALIIADNHGIQFLIRDMFTIDKNSRRILDRFL